jgi:glycine C-acetyltransferase
MMARNEFLDLLKSEIKRIDDSHTAKRGEMIIDGYTSDANPKAIIGSKKYTVFNSNDYLGLRHHPKLKQTEAEASEKFGTGPGAVRFISGTLRVHKELESEIAKFHSRDDAIVFSSAFAANLATLFCLTKGQSKVSLVNSDVLVVSDELNHRSIIDGIRLANLAPEQKAIFKHLNYGDLDRVLSENVGKFARVVLVTDGVFSMLGELQNIAKINTIIKKYDAKYSQGILLVVDDCHGVGACGKTGRGCEEIFNSKADLLIGTLGKAFGADGGYVTGSQVLIDYLRESAATYIYSNSISPGTAGAALAAITLLKHTEGKALLKKLEENVTYFKEKVKVAHLELAADSAHPIQPLLIGDGERTKKLKSAMFKEGFLITNINYPIVPQKRDEIRVQISATHTFEEIDLLVKYFKTQFGK